MYTRSSSNLPGESSPNPTSSNPKRHNRRRSKQPFILEESPVDTMADQRTMAELLRAPTEGYAEAIMVPSILAEHFELKHSLINMMTLNQFFGLEKDNPRDHIRWFNKITSTIKYKDVPNLVIKLMLFPFSLSGAACRWLEKEPPRSILTWEYLVSKFINEFFPSSRTTNIRNEISNFQQRSDELFHEAWDRYIDLLRACPHHGFTELHQLDTFYNALNSADQDSLNSVAGGSLLERRTQDVLTIIKNKSKQTSDVTTAMTDILKQFQATPPPAFLKAVEEICVTCGGAHPYYQCLAAKGNTFSEFRDNVQGYVLAAAVNYNQGNSCYSPLGVANKIRPSGFAQPNVQNNQNRFSQPQGYNRGNNFNQDSSYQAPMQQNQIVPLSELEKIKKMNEINMKAIFFQMNTAFTSGLGPLPSNTIANPKGELKSITTRSVLVLDGPSVPTPPLFINPEEDERVEETLTDLDLAEYTIKAPPTLQFHINITLDDALILILKYQKILKARLSNKKKLLELANTPLNENCSAVILKKLPEKLGDPGKFLIPCGFSELKYKSLADLDASINLMPLSVWKKLGLPELISTRTTLELDNRAICTPAGVARGVILLVGKFTFLADFVIVDYESDPRVPLILGRPFLHTARALIDDCLEDLFATTHLSGNPTFSPHTKLTLPEVKDDIFDPEGDIVLIDKLINLYSAKDLPPPHNINPLSGSTTSSSSDQLLEEIDSILEDSVDKCNLANPNDNLVDTSPEMFTDEHTLDYSSPPLYDEYDDDLVELKSDNDNAYNDPFDSKEDKIKESKLLIDELDLPRSSDLLPSLEYDSFLFEDFFEVDALPSTNNEDKVFNQGILIHDNIFEDTVQATPYKNVKKRSISHASLILEDFNPPLYELPFYKEIPWPETLLLFSSKNEEKVFKPGILTSK
nr:hypothetical protein [Tanacetum cinerariifolium]